jgi:hypothetical protein
MHTGLFLKKKNPMERDHMEDLGISERIILKYILNRMEGCGLGFFVQDRTSDPPLVNMVTGS